MHHKSIEHLHFPNLKLISDKLHEENVHDTAVNKHIWWAEVQIHTS